MKKLWKIVLLAMTALPLAVAVATPMEQLESDIAAAEQECQALTEKIVAERAELTARIIKLENGLDETERRSDELRRRKASDDAEMARLDEELSMLEARLSNDAEMMRDMAQRYGVDEDNVTRALARRLRERRALTPIGATAADADGIVVEGQMIELGPSAYFIDGKDNAYAVCNVGDALPRLVDVPREMQDAIRKMFQEGHAEVMPVDIAGTGDVYGRRSVALRLRETFRRGGDVMYAIAALGWFALLVVVNRLWFFWRWPLKRIRSEWLDGAADENTRWQMAQQAIRRAEHLLPALSICASVAPLLGLFGTVTGMIRIFDVIAQGGAANAERLSGGISEALITTEAGLAIAIPTLLLHAWFARKVHRMAAELEEELQ